MLSLDHGPRVVAVVDCDSSLRDSAVAWLIAHADPAQWSEQFYQDAVSGQCFGSFQFYCSDLAAWFKLAVCYNY